MNFYFILSDLDTIKSCLSKNGFHKSSLLEMLFFFFYLPLSSWLLDIPMTSVPFLRPYYYNPSIDLVFSFDFQWNSEIFLLLYPYFSFSWWKADLPAMSWELNKTSGSVALKAQKMLISEKEKEVRMSFIYIPRLPKSLV